MATVTAWTGSVGGYVLSQSTAANKPFYATGSNGDAQSTGGATVVFDGSNDELSLFGFNNPLATMPKSSSIYSVLSYIGVASPVGDEVIWGWGDKDNLRFLEHRFDVSENQYTTIGGGVNTPVSSSTTGSAVVSAFIDDNVNSWMTINGNTSSLDDSWNSAALDAFTLGSRGIAAKGLPMSGSITEVLITERAVTAIEIEAYKRHILKTYLDPENISGLRHRWKGDNGISTDDTFGILSWEDSIGGARVNDGGSGTPFNVHYDQPDRYNGHPFISSSVYTDDLIGNALDIYPTLSGSHTFFIVAERRATGVLETLFDMYNDAVGTDQRIWLYFQNNDFIYYRVRVGGVLEINAFGNGAGMSCAEERPYAVCVSYDADAATNNMKFHINGITQIKSQAVGATPAITGSDKFKLYSRDGANQPTSGPEVILFDRVLTEAEMQRLTSYARLKYGIA